MSGIAVYRDLTESSRLLKHCLFAYLAISLMGLWFGWMEIGLLRQLQEGVDVPQEKLEASDSRQMIYGILFLLVYLTTAILFLRWIYFSHQNAKALGADDLQFTPGSAVGWYFVPFANWWKPYQAMRETFLASQPGFGSDWSRAPRPPILPIWWTFWILDSVIANAATRVFFRAETLEDYIGSSKVSFASDLAALPLGCAALILVGKLQTWQSEKRSRFAPDAV